MPRTLDPITLTHARLRRQQGDVRGAIEIVEALIDQGREDDELWALYVGLGGERQRPRYDAPDAPVGAPVAANAALLRDQFAAALRPERQDRRAQRLRRWLDRIQNARAAENQR